MLLILSESNDLSTSQVMKWLLHYNISTLRINKEIPIEIINFQLSNENGINICIKYNNNTYELNLFDQYWYRRGQIFMLRDRTNKLESIKQSKVIKAVEAHINDEVSIVLDFIYDYLEQLPKIGSFQTRGVNKLKALKYAIKHGISTPYTYITNSKNLNIENFSKTSFITKSIYEAFTVDVNNYSFMTYTEEVNTDKIKNKIFYYSLFQEKIEKEADIRIFYLNKKFYSMAIMSQNDNQTKTDFRKYNNKKMVRYFPFKIPQYLEVALNKVMDDLKLETASIDMVFSKSGDFVFLEANPVGQFSMTSVPCNYYLEKLIANEFLTKKKY
jgi:ATP-GRASP peptide maturase of grasp-with-spasm system